MKPKENEDLIKCMETIEIAQAEELSRLRQELSNRDKADLVEEVANFEAKAWAAEDYLWETVFARDSDIEKATEEEVVKFKDSEEFAALLEKKYEACREMPRLRTSSTTSGSNTEILTTDSWGENSRSSWSSGLRIKGSVPLIMHRHLCPLL